MSGARVNKPPLGPRRELRADGRQLAGQLERHLRLMGRVQIRNFELPGRGRLDSELVGEGDDAEVFDDNAGRRGVNVGDPAVDVGPVEQF